MTVSDASLYLSDVTLCAVTSVNVDATVCALQACLDQITFADCILLTDVELELSDPRIRIERIAPLRTSEAYSGFILTTLFDYIATGHCMVVQWDGHVLDARHWRPEFLDYDYIGASWPQFSDGYNVGNGGFSLRSSRLMKACRSPQFERSHPEDIAIGRRNRAWLEEQGMRFPSREVADLFSAERAGDPSKAFGYHGVFNMPRALGKTEFWKIYGMLDSHSTIARDFWPLVRAVSTGSGGWLRALRMMVDRMGGGRHG